MDKARFVPCQQHSSSSTLHVWLVGEFLDGKCRRRERCVDAIMTLDYCRPRPWVGDGEKLADDDEGDPKCQ